MFIYKWFCCPESQKTLIFLFSIIAWKVVGLIIFAGSNNTLASGLVFRLGSLKAFDSFADLHSAVEWLELLYTVQYLVLGNLCYFRLPTLLLSLIRSITSTFFFNFNCTGSSYFISHLACNSISNKTFLFFLLLIYFPLRHTNLPA